MSSSESVWKLLVDSQNFPKWNPIIRYVAGELRENRVLKALIQVSQKQYDSKIKILSLIPNTELRWKIIIPIIRLGRFVFFSKEIEQTFLIQNLPNNHGVHNNGVWFVQKVSFIHNRLNRAKKISAFVRSTEELNCALKTIAEETNLRSCNSYTNAKSNVKHFKN